MFWKKKKPAVNRFGKYKKIRTIPLAEQTERNDGMIVDMIYADNINGPWRRGPYYNDDNTYKVTV